tara:strand:- start:209 stop:877 length:669 start_codon:yes stop_codon:yes gene_type:complete
MIDYEFLSFHESDFFEKYGQLGEKFHTFRIALNLFHQRKGSVIVETGCQREVDDWGAGQSTKIFGEYVSKYDAFLYTVDISLEKLRIAEEISGTTNIEYVNMDSVQFLKTFNKKIDLLYLDSLDFPLHELFSRFGESMYQMSFSEVVSRSQDILMPCQIHCLNEVIASEDKFHNNSLVLIDDNALIGGGKARLARDWLFTRGWEVIADWNQTLWQYKHKKKE